MIFSRGHHTHSLIRSVTKLCFFARVALKILGVLTPLYYRLEGSVSSVVLKASSPCITVLYIVKQNSQTLLYLHR